MAFARASAPGRLAVQILCLCRLCFAANVLRIAQLGEDVASGNSGYDRGFRQFVVPHINTNSPITLNGQQWTIEVVNYDLTGLANDDPIIADAVNNASNGLDMDGDPVGEIHAIAAATSKKNTAIMRAAQTAQIPQLHMSGGNPAMWQAESATGNTYGFGMHLPFITYTRGPLRIAATRGLKTIMIISTIRHGFSRLSCIAALEWARENSLEVVGPSTAWCGANSAGYQTCRVVGQRCVCGAQADVDNYGFKWNIEEVNTYYEMKEDDLGNGYVGNTVDDGTTEFVRKMFQDAKAQGKTPDIILNFAQEGENVLRAMFLEDYTPKMILGWHGGTLANWAEATTDGNGVDMTAKHGYWAVGFGQWHKAMTLSDPVFGTNAEAVTKYETAMSEPLGYDGAGAVGVGVVLYKVLTSYVSSTFASLTTQEQRDELRTGIGNMNDETMWGTVRFNRFNQNNGRGTAAWQIVPDANQVAQQLCILPTEAQEIELQIPFPTWESRFGCPQGTYNTLYKCEACEEGTFQASTGAGMKATTCDTCPSGVGTVVGATGSTTCSACPAGYSNEGSTGICSLCSEGKYSNGSMTECDFCPPGTRSSSTRTSCVVCLPGTFSQFRGSSECSGCAAGSFSDAPGSSECSRCGVGTYAGTAGLSTCSSCGEGKSKPDNWETLQELQVRGEVQFVALEGASSEDSCGCRQGTYPVGAECVECIEGMDCPGMGNLSILPGYFAMADSPGHVFQCFSGTKRCPGGAPGTCAPGRDDSVIACALCQDNMKAKADGSCDECGGADKLPFVAAMMGAIVVLILIYYMVDNEKQAKQSHSLLLVAVACGQTITFGQQLGVLSSMSVTWPHPFTDLLDLGLILTFDLEVLDLGCLASVTALSQYSLRVFCVFLFFVLMLSIHAAFVAVMHKMNFRGRMSSLIGSTGAVFMAFFISIVSSILAPFQCNLNPNGLFTMRAYMNVVCWEWDSHEEHQSMFAVACVGVLIPIAFLAYCSWALRSFPDAIRTGRTQFLHAHAFLLFRFRPEAYWYALLFLVRNALVAMTPVFTSTFGQIIFMQCIVLPCLMVTVYVQPWRVGLANALDICTSTAILVVLCLAAFVSDEEYDQDLIAGLCCAAFSVSMVGALLALVFGMWERFIRSQKPYKYFICHHKAGAGNLARLLKMFLVDQSTVGNRVFVDSDDLGNLNMLFKYVAQDTETLVVLCSSAIFSRPWCVGEMTTAKSTGIAVKPVILSDFEPPTDDFIEKYAMYVPDVQLLANYGMDLPDVLEAIQWTAQLPSIEFARSMSREAVSSCMYELMGVVGRRSSTDLQAVGPKTEAVIVLDTSSSEAVCTALALQKLLVGSFISALEKVPAILTDSKEWPETCKQVVVVCSNGCFANPALADCLHKAVASAPYVLPVISEAGFRFPTMAFYKETFTNEYAAKMAAMGEVEAKQHALTYVQIIKRVFVEIGVEFNPQDSEDVMSVRATTVADRLKSAVGQLKLQADDTLAKDIMDELEGKPTVSVQNNVEDTDASQDANPGLEI